MFRNSQTPDRFFPPKSGSSEPVVIREEEAGESEESALAAPDDTVETAAVRPRSFERSSATDRSAGETTIGEQATITGRIEARGTLRIDGRVEGEVEAHDVVIVGPSGMVEADLLAASVTVSGQVTGNIVATSQIELQPTAVVKGEIHTAIGALTIQSGARIDGRCTMTADPMKPAGGQAAEDEA